MVYPTKDKAMNDIASWIDLRYNYVRLHSALGCRTPNEVERELLDLRRQPETQTSTVRKTPSSPNVRTHTPTLVRTPAHATPQSQQQPASSNPTTPQ